DADADGWVELIQPSDVEARRYFLPVHVDRPVPQRGEVERLRQAGVKPIEHWPGANREMVVDAIGGGGRHRDIRDARHERLVAADETVRIISALTERSGHREPELPV